MTRKKFIAGLLTTALAFGTMTGCGAAKTENTEAAESTTAAEVQAEKDYNADVKDTTEEVVSDPAVADKSLKIVTTIFPEYDWVKSIMGDKAENSDITLLLDNGVDLHSYQPTVDDIAKIKQCDMFVYVGGESDAWVDDVIATAENDSMVVINLLDVLGDSVKAEEVVEGMEAEHDHDHEHEDADHDHEDADHDHEDGDEDHDHEEADADHDHEDGDEDHDHDHEEEEEEMDEHVWLSLRNADVICGEIAKELGNLDEANKDLYQQNYEAYKTELENLDAQYKEAVDNARVKTVLFGDRFPFRYLVDDYGLDYYAAFTGCSAESEASFETVIFLAQKTDELDLHAIMTIEGDKNKIAETVKENTANKNQKILVLNSLQSVTSDDVKNGTTYMSVMQSNLDVLKEALQ